MRKSSVSLLAGFTDAQLDAIMRHAKEHRLECGATIIKEGAVGDSMFMVLDGSVKVTKRVRADTSEVTVLSEGSLIGEMNFIEEGGRRSATVCAHTDVTVMEFDGPGLREECARDRDLAAKLYSVLARVLTRYLRSTTRDLAQAKALIKSEDKRVEDDLRRMATDLKRRMAKDAAPRA